MSLTEKFQNDIDCLRKELAAVKEENRKYKEALEDIVEECRDDFCVKIKPEYTPPCSCGIASKALAEGKQ